MSSITPLNSFTISRLPRILFGRATFAPLTREIASYGKRVLIVTGGSSFTNGSHWRDLQTQLNAARITWSLVRIPGEPSPKGPM